MSVLYPLFQTLCNWVYPPICLHCGTLCKRSPLCEACASLLELLDPNRRCPTCFAEKVAWKICRYCQGTDLPFNRVGAALDYVGPAGALLCKLSLSGFPPLAKGLSSYLLMQWVQLGWPKPDLIVPVPLAFTQWVGRGFNPSELLAKELGSLLGCPILNCIKRRSGDFQEKDFILARPNEFVSGPFSLIPNCLLEDRTLLLIGDLYSTGNTLFHCGEALHAGFPAAIYGLTLCKKMAS